MHIVYVCTGMIYWYNHNFLTSVKLQRFIRKEETENPGSSEILGGHLLL